MGSTRRGRTKNEGTFLELVKDALEQLSRDVSQIRDAVEDLKNVNYCHVDLPPPAPPCLDTYSRRHLLAVRSSMNKTGEAPITVRKTSSLADYFVQPYDGCYVDWGNEVFEVDGLDERESQLRIEEHDEVTDFVRDLHDDDDPVDDISKRIRNAQLAAYTHKQQKRDIEREPRQASADVDLLETAYWATGQWNNNCDYSDVAQQAMTQSAKPVEDTGSHTVGFDNKNREGINLCEKCDEKFDDCMCDEIFCRSCFRRACECRCSRPQLKRRVCSLCSAVEDSGSIFDAGGISSLRDLPTTFSCSECGGHEYEEDGFYFVQSAKTCASCKKLGYQDMEWCSGKKCASDSMFHKDCLQQLRGRRSCAGCTHSAYDNGALEESESEDKDEDDALTADSTSSDDGRTTAHAHWNEEEIMLWMQVTLRMLEGKTHEKARADLLRERWNAAKQRIPIDKRERLQNLIEEKFRVGLNP